MGDAALLTNENYLTTALMWISYRLPASTREWRRVKMRVSFLSLTSLSHFSTSSLPVRAGQMTTGPPSGHVMNV